MQGARRRIREGKQVVLLPVTESATHQKIVPVVSQPVIARLNALCAILLTRAQLRSPMFDTRISVGLVVIKYNLAIAALAMLAGLDVSLDRPVDLVAKRHFLSQV